MNRDWASLRHELQYILDDEVANGNECGCQLCICEHGKTVIDLAAGYTTADKTQRVSANSLFPLFSTGKAFLAALTWRLQEDGLFSYNTPVANFWKEFASPEKSGITIEHLLSHRAGLYLLPSGKPDLTDWQQMCNLIAAMPPRNLPGKKCHYHPLTFAWLLGHTLELVTGKSLPELISEKLLKILGLTGMIYFGIDDNAEKNVVPVDDSLIPVKPAWEAVHMNDSRLRRCCIPSFNGIGSARAVAGFYSKLRGKYVSEQTFDYATGKLFRDPDDPVRPDQWSKFALGLILAGPEENRRMFCGHGGAAGAEGFYMPDLDIAVGFTKNRLSPKHPEHPVRDRISNALDIPCRFW